MRGLLLSSYAAASHRYWAQGLMRWMDDIDWTLLELPARHFAWRIRGNPLTWHWREQAVLASSYDVVVATSMVDLATLVGLHPHLGRARRVVYFHENQFAYPASQRQASVVEAQMVTLYAALAADQVAFNSAYNRDSFIEGARAFLKRMPENLPAFAPLEALRDKAMIVPVPLEPASQKASPVGSGNLIVWNHRWEYDKNPEAFFRVLFRLSEQGVSFQLAVMGQRFGEWPAVFDEAQERLRDHLVCWGPQSAAEYIGWLDAADIVISTTWHEFQGLAIMEAVQHGCVPLVPDRLCFPEYYAEAYRYADEAALHKRLEHWLSEPSARPVPPQADNWTWPAQRTVYRQLLGSRAL